jgi:hypothetical protein
LPRLFRQRRELAAAQATARKRGAVPLPPQAPADAVVVRETAAPGV